MELKRILNILWRRKWYFLQAVVLIPLVTILISQRLPGIYETSAKVLVKPSETESSSLSSLGLMGAGVPGTDTSLALESRIELFKVDELLISVIERLQLRDSKGELLTTKKILKAPFIISSFFPAPVVKFEQVSDTDMIEITARSPDPEEAAMMANVFSELYIEEGLAERKKEYAEARAFIDAQLGLVKSQYLEAAEKIRNFRIENQTVDLEDETRSAIEHMENLLKEKERIVRAATETRARISELEVHLELNTGERASGTALIQNPQIELLKRTISELELQLAAAGSEKTEAHPDVIALQDQLARAKSEMAAELALFSSTSSDLQGLKRDLAALVSEHAEVRKQITAYEDVLMKLPAKAYGQSHLALTYQLNQDLYGTLLEHSYELGIAEAMLPSDTRLVETAAIPDIDSPASPSLVLNAIVSMVLATMLGLALAFGVEYMDDTIKGPADLRVLGLRILGLVPRFSFKGHKSIAKLKPTHRISEAYRTIRASLRFAALDKPVKSILVTSAWPSEGKTTTAVNLAISYAMSGSKVLLMDADHRKPAVHSAFGLPQSPGLAELLTGEISFDEAVCQSGVDDLLVVTCGRIPIDPAGMVESAQMKSVIKKFQEQYDIVITDSPPVSAGTDAIYLAQYADVAVLIARASRATHHGMSHVSQVLAQASVDIAGVVLNRFSSKSQRSYYYGPYSEPT